MLGNGSYGTVFVGKYGPHELPVVAKRAADDKNSHAYLEVEGYCNQKLSSLPGAAGQQARLSLAPFIGSATQGGHQWLVWQQTGTGRTLRDFLVPHHLPDLIEILGLSPKSALHDLLFQFVQLVSLLHKAGIVHRDFKPENILVDEEEGRLRLIDLGSAADMKAFARKGYNYRKSPCSPVYCAPEEFIDEKHPWQFDVYSVAICWMQCVFTCLDSSGAMVSFREELGAAKHNADTWLQAKLSDDALADGFIDGLTFFTEDGGRGWRLLKRMLEPDPSKRITVDELLSDPYLLGGGGKVSRRREVSKAYFQEVMDRIDVCDVSEHTQTVRVTLPKPLGLVLEEGDGPSKVAGAVVTEVLAGGAAQVSEMVNCEDRLIMIGDIPTSAVPFDEVMGLLRDCPSPIALAFEREVSDLVPQRLTQPPSTRLAPVDTALDTGVASIKGLRGAQEDAFAVSSFTVTPINSEEPVVAHFGAVFDGHRGKQASEYAAKSMPAQVKRALMKRHLSEDDTILQGAWDAVAKGYQEEGYQAGSTAAAALVVDGNAHFLNCGDSRVLVTSFSSEADTTDEGEVGVAFQSRDHSPADSQERDRIEAGGGKVYPGLDLDNLDNLDLTGRSHQSDLTTRLH
ncbi:unnamed protein product [Chrysoparadoxa australica]